MDDFLLFSNDNAVLADMRTRAGKTGVYRTAEGVTFLGWRLFPDRLRLERGNVARFRRRLRDLHAAFVAGQTGWANVTARVRAWIAHAGHGDTQLPKALAAWAIRSYNRTWIRLFSFPLKPELDPLGR